MTATFREQVVPLLARYCTGCHGGARPKAALDLAALAGGEAAGAGKAWERVLHQLEAGDMPPPDRPRPSPEELRRITHGIEALLSQADCRLPGDPGRVTLRRLNRAEYNNTIRDLVGIDFRPADDFPSDDVGYGFDNIGDVLTIPPLLMEKYLAAAETIATRAIVADGPSPKPIRKWEAKDITDAGGTPLRGDRAAAGLRRGDRRRARAAEGRRVRPARPGLRAAGRARAGPDGLPARRQDRRDRRRAGRRGGRRRLRGARPGRRRPRKIAVAFVNDYYEPKDPDPKKRGDRNLAVESLEVLALVDDGPIRKWEAKDVTDAGGNPYGGTARLLSSVGEIAVAHALPKDGEYVLRARAFGQQAGPEPARMAFRLDGKTVTTVDVPAVEGDAGVYEVRVRAGAGPRKIAVAFVNDYYEPKDPDPKKRGDRNLVVESLEVQGPAGSGDRPRPETHTRILFCTPTETSRAECARRIIERFAGRAFRRPATREEVERLARFVELAGRNGDGFEKGIQLAVQAILVSPQFLFRVELDRPGGPPGAAEPLDDYELASRLSYFLWSSMPDEELFDLAGGARCTTTRRCRPRRGGC
jgi:hypothetical protein